MKSTLVKKGLILLTISIIFRIVSFIYFSYSWQWSNPIITLIDIMFGVVFIFMWFIYGLRNEVGVKNGIIIGLIGISDGLLLQVLTLILYITREGHNFGPVTMMPWVIPFLGIDTNFRLITDMILYYIPFVAMALTVLGSLLGEKLK